MCGVLLALVTAFWSVTATADLALSAGLYGTPGTYKVNRCYDTNSSGKNSHYDCYGDFTPDGGSADDADYVHLEDTGHDYPDGSTFDARQGIEPDTIQRAGFGGVVGELWQVAVCWSRSRPPRVPAGLHARRRWRLRQFEYPRRARAGELATPVNLTSNTHATGLRCHEGCRL